MIYRVQLALQPIVVDANGLRVADSNVVEITFPGVANETARGRVNTIVGSGIVKSLLATTLRSAGSRCARTPHVA